MVQQHPITIFTIRHSGTHFCAEFLKELGLRKRPLNSELEDGMYDRLHASALPIKIKQQWQYIDSAKVIITARDPYLSTIRQMHRSRNKKVVLKRIANAWDNFLTTLPKIDHCILDIGCAEKKRIEMLTNIVNHIGYEPTKFQNIITAYASNWKPLHTSNTQDKIAYIKTGILPEEYHHPKLEEAMDWYKSLK